MSRRKVKYIPKSFESHPNFLPKKRNGNNATDVSANIYISMLMSKAWHNLTGKQKELYLYCKAQYYGEKKTNAEHLTIQEKEEKTNVNTDMRFTMNKSKWCDIYGIYSESGKRHFYKDMQALIDNGFVEILQNGKTNRTKNIYIFSDKWADLGKWKTP